MRAFLLPIGRENYALPIEVIREVVPQPSVTPVPTAPESVCGLFNVRGEIIPLLDTAALLGIGSVGRVAFAVVVESPAGPAGLAVSDLPRAVDLDDPVAEADGEAATGTHALGGGLVVMLDPARLIAPGRIRGIQP